MGLLGIQIIWTSAATLALKNARTDKKIMADTDSQFQVMLDSLIEVTTKELSKIERTKFETLITIHLHQRDIFHALVSIILRVRRGCELECMTFLSLSFPSIVFDAHQVSH